MDCEIIKGDGWKKRATIKQQLNLVLPAVFLVPNPIFSY